MAKIYKLFSHEEDAPKTHTLESANQVLAFIRRFTDEAIEQSENLASQMSYHPKSSAAYKKITAQYDQVILQWVERVHRLGAVAKGLWLVDFDTGRGYLCWAYPEEKIEYFHSYDGGYKTREKIDHREYFG